MTEKLKLKNVRLSYPRLAKAEPFKGAGGDTSPPRFSATFLIPKTDTETVNTLKKTLMDTAVEEWKDKGPEELKRLFATNKVCLVDGDVIGTEGYEGCYALRTSAQADRPPVLVDRNAKEVTDRDLGGRMLYAGCYVNAIVRIWAQNNGYGKRLNCSVEAVQFNRDGDAFSGAKPASASDFEPLEPIDAFEDAAPTAGAAPAPAAAGAGLMDFI